MEKEELRNGLFEKYFEVMDGVLITDLINNTESIRVKWKGLHKLLVENVRFFNEFSPLDAIKCVRYKNNKYLVIKIIGWKYIIIDLDKKISLSKNQAKTIFDEQFFIDNFLETRVDMDICFMDIYSILDYDGDIDLLINFYVENKEIFDIVALVYYKIEIGDAWTYLNIDLANHNTQLGFQTPDQFLYECLFLREDLTPSALQDAQSKIGLEKMYEMFERIKSIKIPIDCIPESLYRYYLKRDNFERIRLDRKE